MRKLYVCRTSRIQLLGAMAAFAVLGGCSPSIRSVKSLTTPDSAQPTRIVLSGSNEFANQVCTSVVLLATDDAGEALAAGSDVEVTFTTDGTGVAFFSDSACTKSIVGGKTTVSAGLSFMTVYFKTAVPQTLKITATVSGFAAAERTLTSDFWGSMLVAGNPSGAAMTYGSIVPLGKNSQNVLRAESYLTATGLASWRSLSSVDGGNTWTSVTNTPAEAMEFYANGAFMDSQGNTYLFGTNYLIDQKWTVWRKAALATSWVKVDQSLASTISTSPSVMFEEAGGHLFIAGYHYDNSISKVIITVRKSTDQGLTWSSEHTYNPNASCFTSSWRAAHFKDPAGNNYIQGPICSGSTTGYALLRKAVGGAWSTADVPLSTSGGGMLYIPSSAMIAGNSGNLYIPYKLYSMHSNGYSRVDRWIVRKSSDGGVTWSLSDEFYLASDQYSGVGALAKDAHGNLYAAGSVIDAGGASHWIIRKLSSDETTWSTVDDYLHPGAWGTHSPNRITLGASGALYVSGTVHPAVNSNPSLWLVRSSTDGTSWSNSDTFHYDGTRTASPGITFRDREGRLNIAGTGTDSAGKTHWLVRRLESSGNWVLKDDYQAEAGFNSSPSGVLLNDSGEAFLFGTATDSEGLKVVIRKK